MTTTPTPLTSEAGLLAHLTTHTTSPTTITLLTGGTANYVYRATLPNGQTIIYKHAAPYLHSNPNFVFDQKRMDYENLVLQILPPLLAKEIEGSCVKAVGWKSYDREAKLLCIQDGGDRNLKMAYEDPRLDIAGVGREIARWIAALHRCSGGTSIALPDDGEEGDVGLKANNQIAVDIYRHSYSNLPTALRNFGHDKEFGEYVNGEFGSRLQWESECVCHGDFWPGNVLVKFRDEEEKERKDVDLTVVDWEMTRRGNSATDVGQFSAEAFLLDRFKGGRGLLPVFLDTYLEARGGDLGRKWVERMAVQWAVHIAFWPTRVEWADREGTQKLVDIGVGVMKAVVDGDWERLKVSDLFREADGDAWERVWTTV